MPYLIGALGGIIAGLIIGIIATRLGQKNLLQQKQTEFDNKLLAEKNRISEDLENTSKERLKQRRQELEQELSAEQERLEAQNSKLTETEQRLQKREGQLDRREQSLDSKFENLDRKEDKLSQREQEYERLLGQLKEQETALAKRTSEFDQALAEVSKMSLDEARQELFKRLDDQLAEEQGRIISLRHKEAEERAREMANEIVGRAIQRYAAEHTAETTTARVKLANEEMKGRIIGKEGRNIRAFQEISGVDVIIDDTPNEITISCFDGVRREVARRALDQLMEDGRIQPARIEEVIQLTQQDMDREVLKRGEDAAYNCDVSGLHPQILKLLGKLQFRTSYGQNVLKHTQEVAYLAGAIAADLGLDPTLGRRCGLLHDIGKAIDHEQEGSHPELGFEALNRYGENEIVANAALAHHEGHDVLTLYTTITAAADAISAARPGARRENVERYIKRLQQLEDIACSFKGVMKSYAIQAGRELRVIVNSSMLEDNALKKVARDIARRVEDEVAYPGEVKVTLIRETRTAAVAR